MNNFDKAYKDLIMYIDELKISNKKKIELFNKIDNITELFANQNNVDKRLSTLENIVLDDEDAKNRGRDVDFFCPYCHKKIDIYMENDKMDITCPYCKNEIEIEWSMDK